MAARLSARRRPAAKPNPAAPPPRDAAPGDNSRMGEEAERVQLISFVSKLSSADADIEAAKGPLKAAQARRKTIVNLAKAAGFTAADLNTRIQEMGRGTRENAQIIARENKHRRWLGILEPEQAGLILGDQAPQEVKDEAHWKGEGYKAGLRLLEAKPPQGVPERFVQTWMAEHGRGFGEATAANAPKPLGVAGQAAADFQADNPEIDVDAAARKLKNDPKFMDRSAPVDATPCSECGCVAMHTKECTIGAAQIEGGESTAIEAGGAAPPVIVGGADPEAAFEATEEELAAQTTRKAVVEGREDPEAVL